MKIAIITPGVLPNPAVKGGAVESLIDIYLEKNEYLHHHQYIVYSIANKQAKLRASRFKNSKFCFVDLHSIRNRLKRLLFRFSKRTFYYHYYNDYYAYDIIKKIKKERVDLLLIENRPGFVLQAKKHLNIPIVLHLHNDTLYQSVPLANEIVKHSSRILTVSNYIKKRVETISFAKGKVSIVYNGIDIESFQNTLPLFNRSDFNILEEDFVVVYSGRLNEIKGVEELLCAFNYLLEYPHIKLLVIGSSNFGCNDKDEYAVRIEQLANKLSSKVIFTGFISYNKIPSLLTLCDIAVVPSICEEAFSLAALEAMAVGLPIVATKSGGLLEVVNDDCAIIVDKTDRQKLPQLIAESIFKLYNNSNLKKEMSNYAKQRSLKFSIDRYYNTMVNELKRFQ